MINLFGLNKVWKSCVHRCRITIGKQKSWSLTLTGMLSDMHCRQNRTSQHRLSQWHVISVTFKGLFTQETWVILFHISTLLVSHCTLSYDKLNRAWKIGDHDWLSVGVITARTLTDLNSTGETLIKSDIKLSFRRSLKTIKTLREQTKFRQDTTPTLPYPNSLLINDTEHK